MAIDHGVHQTLVNKKKRVLFNAVKQQLSENSLRTLQLAFDVADHAHFGQMRKSGEPYITHPLEVAITLAEWGLDAETISAALLHDVIEDTMVSADDLTQIFGGQITALVDSVTKLDKLSFKSAEAAHAEYARKVVLAMARDIRVILIKLADRLHNIMTLSSIESTKKRAIALETMEIYVPIAHRIGLYSVYLKLADACFQHLHPKKYNNITNIASEFHDKHLSTIRQILNNMSNTLQSNSINARVICKQRNIYSIHKHIGQSMHKLCQIADIFEIKVIVHNIGECYLALGIIHSIYQPMDRFKDYIAIPKHNGYQALHSTLMGPHGMPLHVYIKTNIMESIAEKGVISQPAHKKITSHLVNNILAIQSGSFSADDFLLTLKNDLIPNDIICVFTPKSKAILLPKNATVLDFAYHIDRSIGDHAKEAIVNSKSAQLNHKLQNNDIIQIVVDNSVEPKDSWVNYVITSKAISGIKQFLKEQKRDDSINNGIKMFNAALELKQLTQLTWREGESNYKTNMLIKQHFGQFNQISFFQQIGVGTLPVLKILCAILELDRKSPLEIKLSDCGINIVNDIKCNPLPGDELLLMLDKHCDLIIHRANCNNTKTIGLDNLVLAHITNDMDTCFLAKIHSLIDNHQPGIFVDFANAITSESVNIEELVQSTQGNNLVIKAALKVKDKDHINRVIAKLSQLPYVKNVMRV